MIYMQFCTTISSQEHDRFVASHPLCNLLQSSNWAKIKCNWEHMIAGVYDAERLLASSLVLIKKLPAGCTMFYIPRGPILDYTDKEVVNVYFRELKKFARKKRCLFIKFDPEIHIRDYEYHEKEASYYPTIASILENLKEVKAIHKGYTTSLKETIQPRFCMGVVCNRDFEEHFPRATIRSIHTAQRKHVNVYRAEIHDLDEFTNIIEMTQQRKHVKLRNQMYFQRLMETYKEHAYLFLATVDPQERYEELQETINQQTALLKEEQMGKKQRHKVEQELQQARQEFASIEKLVKTYHGEQVIAGGLMIGFGDTVEMLYAGMNEDFKAFRPQYLTYMEQFSFARSQGYRYVNMGGVEGTLEDGLSTYKANFTPFVNEYIGEFDLPVYPFLYPIVKWFYDRMQGCFG